jgi:hypothetical protein
MLKIDKQTKYLNLENENNVAISEPVQRSIKTTNRFDN